jgi:ribose transport system permease protein
MTSKFKSIRQVLPLLLAIIVLLGLFRIWVPQFLGLENLLDLAQQISVNAILAFGMTLVILIGGIDLSVGAVVALIGTVTVAVLARHGLGLVWWLGFAWPRCSERSTA